MHTGPRQRRTARRLAQLLCWSLLILFAGSCLPVSPTDGSVPIFNFHVLDPGMAYRSGQPNEWGLLTAINQLGLKTVINLRGPNAGKSWYDAERALCDDLGVTQIDLPMSANRLPSGELLADLLEALQTAERPFLIHCQSGADRTGAAAGLYRIVVLGQDKTQAMTELTPFTLHLRAFTPCMDWLVESYEPTSEWLDWYAANVDQISCTP